MPHRYTDVDRMILNRWTEVTGLREAFDELLDRMRDVLGDTLPKAVEQARIRGFECDFNAKLPSLWFWKPAWAAKSSKEAGVYFFVSDFAPMQYGKSGYEHPETTVRIEDLHRLKIRDRPAFAQAVKAALPKEIRTKWESETGALDECPLGLSHRTISPLDRVNWMQEPAALIQFLAEKMDEAMEVVPGVDKALAEVAR